MSGTNDPVKTSMSFSTGEHRKPVCPAIWQLIGPGVRKLRGSCWGTRSVTGTLIPAHSASPALPLNVNKCGFKRLEGPEDVGRAEMVFFTLYFPRENNVASSKQHLSE